MPVIRWIMNHLVIIFVTVMVVGGLVYQDQIKQELVQMGVLESSDASRLEVVAVESDANQNKAKPAQMPTHLTSEPSPQPSPAQKAEEEVTQDTPENEKASSASALTPQQNQAAAQADFEKAQANAKAEMDKAREESQKQAQAQHAEIMKRQQEAQAKAQAQQADMQKRQQEAQEKAKSQQAEMMKRQQEAQAKAQEKAQAQQAEMQKRQQEAQESARKAAENAQKMPQVPEAAMTQPQPPKTAVQVLKDARESQAKAYAEYQARQKAAYEKAQERAKAAYEQSQNRAREQAERYAQQRQQAPQQPYGVQRPGPQENMYQRGYMPQGDMGYGPNAGQMQDHMQRPMPHQMMQSPTSAKAQDLSADVRKLWAEARTAYWQRDVTKAIELYQNLVAEADTLADAAGELGNIYFMQRRFDDAADMYFEAGLRLLNSDTPMAVRSVMPTLYRLDPNKANELRTIAQQAHASAMEEAQSEEAK